jgi:hypothetical protein
VVAVDGTKVHANASQQRNRGYEQIVRDILAEADAIDHRADAPMDALRRIGNHLGGWG